MAEVYGELRDGQHPNHFASVGLFSSVIGWVEGYLSTKELLWAYQVHITDVAVGFVCILQSILVCSCNFQAQTGTLRRFSML